MHTQLEYVVVSEGPYRLYSRRACVCANNRSTSSRFKASPATFTTSTAGSRPLDSSRALSAEGTVLISLTSCVPSPKASTLTTMSMRPPVVSGAKHSNTERSKFNEVENKVLARLAGGKARAAQARKFTVFRCSTTTPLGRPVEPEV